MRPCYVHRWVTATVAWLALSGATGAYAAATQMDAAAQAATRVCLRQAWVRTHECAIGVVAMGDVLRLSEPTEGDGVAFKLRVGLGVGERLVAILHTHPGRDARADVFSDDDERIAERLAVPSYIYVMRSGALRLYSPRGHVYQGGDAGRLVARL